MIFTTLITKDHSQDVDLTKSPDAAHRPQIPIHQSRGPHPLSTLFSRLWWQSVFTTHCLGDFTSEELTINGFADDIDALKSGAKYIQALIPAVVNIVYRKLLQYDITARAFTTRSTAFEGPLDENPDEESPQILHRKMFLRAYLKKLCSDPTQMEFWEYLDKVG